MFAVKPIYIVALVLVILFVVYIKISNPYRNFSTKEFWQDATIDSVNEIPIEALKPGNRNGPVLMWAAIGSTDPEILKALVARGASVNESDGMFKGTPLTGAAGYTTNPEIIHVLIDLGADIHKTVHNDETALMIAAQYNTNPGIISALIKNGARLSHESETGKTALDYAKQHNNEVAIKELEQSDN